MFQYFKQLDFLVEVIFSLIKFWFQGERTNYKCVPQVIVLENRTRECKVLCKMSLCRWLMLGPFACKTIGSNKYIHKIDYLTTLVFDE